MADDFTQQRIDIKKLDKQAINNISSEVARSLSEIAEGDPNDAFHLKLGHIKGSFGRSIHKDFILGEPPQQQQAG
jgi:hypothetical protein